MLLYDMPYVLFVSALASIEVLEYNKSDLQRMLERESKEQSLHRKQELGSYIDTSIIGCFTWIKDYICGKITHENVGLI